MMERWTLEENFDFFRLIADATLTKDYIGYSLSELDIDTIHALCGNYQVALVAKRRIEMCQNMSAKEATIYMHTLIEKAERLEEGFREALRRREFFDACASLSAKEPQFPLTVIRPLMNRRGEVLRRNPTPKEDADDVAHLVAAFNSADNLDWKDGRTLTKIIGDSSSTAYAAYERILKSPWVNTEIRMEIDVPKVDSIESLEGLVILRDVSAPFVDHLHMDPYISFAMTEVRRRKWRMNSAGSSVGCCVTYDQRKVHLSVFKLTLPSDGVPYCSVFIEKSYDLVREEEMELWKYMFPRVVLWIARRNHDSLVFKYVPPFNSSWSGTRG